MSITKTGLTVTANGERAIYVEHDGQQSSLAVTGLNPNKQYTAVPYIIDTDFGRIDGRPYAFNTLPTGTLTITNATAQWQTNIAQVNFSCNWESTYNIPSDINNCKLLVSINSDMSNAHELSTQWSSGGNSGQISAQITDFLPLYTTGAFFYVKVKMIDEYNETIYSPLSAFQAPTNGSAGSMSFSTHRQTDGYTFWIHSTIISTNFTYPPAKKWIVYSKDNWVTEQRSNIYNWTNNSEIFHSFTEPDTYAVELVCMDAYGEQFRTNQGTTLTITVPVAFYSNTTRGSASYWVRLNPNLAYTDVGIEYQSTDGQGLSGYVSLYPLSGYDIRGTIPLPDGDYMLCCYIFYGTSGVELGENVNLTVTNVGWLDLTNTSTIDSNMNLHWSADFDSEYMLTGTCTLYLYDDDVELIGSYTVNYDQNTTNGTMSVSQTIPIAGYSFVECYVQASDVEGNTVRDEFVVYDAYQE